MSFKIAFDSDGLIVQTDGDGGDCAARTGELYTLLAVRERMGISNADWPTPQPFLNALDKLAPGGILVRYPRPENGYNNPSDTTRDQTMPMIIASAYTQNEMFAIRQAEELDNHFDTFPNGDPAGPAEWGIIDRCRNDMTWLIYLGDLQLIFSVLTRCFIGLIPSNVGDDINLTLYLLCTMDFRPTWLSKIAVFLYRKLRPRGVQYAFDVYHSPESHANPLNELARPVIAARLSR